MIHPGLYGTIVPKNMIKYWGELTDRLILENPDNKEIIYSKDNNGFFIITDDPMSVWLSEEDLASQWTKSKTQGLEHCIEKALNSVNKL